MSLEKFFVFKCLQTISFHFYVKQAWKKSSKNVFGDISRRQYQDTSGCDTDISFALKVRLALKGRTSF